MALRFARLRDSLRSSLWFTPTVLVGIAFILAEGALRFDQRSDSRESNWFLFGGGAESARSVVETIATSMLTFTGLVFTITMLVLQLASNQFSPRVMRTFLRDRGNQFVLGTFVATYVYALLVLRRITNAAEADAFVPALSVWIALILVLFSIALFIYYIHHIAQSIRPTSVMARVANETQHAIEHLYPAGIGDGAAPVAEPEWPVATTIVLSPGPSGLLTRIDESQIAAVARDSRCLIELRATLGDFVREGAPLFRISGAWDGNADARLQDAVNFGVERTMDQDAAFGFRQLVDIGQRALSPGINDPSTAVQAIDQLHSLLGHLVRREIPPAWRELDGSWIILPRPSWADFVTLACDEIREAGRRQIQVQRRLRAMLLDLLEVASPERRAPLEEQLLLLDADLSESFDDRERTRAATPSSQGQGPASRFP